MLSIFILTNIFYVFIGQKFYKKKLNPVSLYSIVWCTVVILYELKLVKYFDLRLQTWGVIFLFQLIYVLGCLVAKDILAINSNPVKYVTTIYESKTIIKIIFILTIISSLAIIPNVLVTYQRYGTNLLEQTNLLYADRLAGLNTIVVPYLTAFIEPALILTGYYFSEYKFKGILIIPILLFLGSSLITGGRYGMVKGVFYILIPYILNNKTNKKVQIDRRQKILILTLVLFFILIFQTLTQNRSSWIEINPYMSPVMAEITKINPSIYKTYIYLTTPIGVLNEFLKNYDINFGSNTLLPLYSMLENLGFNITIEKYQEFYAIPIESNVGTYIRELVQDYGILLGSMITCSAAFIYSYNSIKFKRNYKIIHLFITTILSWGVIFSFFMWDFRSSNSWIAIIVGLAAVLYIEKKSVEVPSDMKNEKLN